MRKKQTTSTEEILTVHKNIQNIFAVPFDKVIDITEDSTKQSDEPRPQKPKREWEPRGIPHGLLGYEKDQNVDDIG